MREHLVLNIIIGSLYFKMTSKVPHKFVHWIIGELGDDQLFVNYNILLFRIETHFSHLCYFAVQPNILH